MQAPTSSPTNWSLDPFSTSAPRPGRRPERLGTAANVDEHDDRRACREWVRLLGDAGWLRYCVPAAFGGALEQAGFPRAGDPARNAGVPLAAGRLCLRHAGPGQWRHHAGGHPGAAGGTTCLRWRAATRLRHSRLSEPDAGSDAGGHDHLAAHASTSLTAHEECWMAPRPGSATAALPTTTACLPRPSPPRARAASPRSWWMPIPRGWMRPNTSPVMAPHPLATLQFQLPGARQRATGRAERWLQAGDADAGHLSRLGRRCCAWAWPAARWQKR
jgi:acyl-CoA dehydrogenase